MSSLSIRAAMIADAAAINRIYNHYIHNTSITFDLEPWSTAHREAWLAQFADDKPHYAIVAELGGEIIGFACNSKFRDKVGYRLSTETSIYTDLENATPGTGNALYTALFQLLEKTDLHRVYAVVALPNPRAVAFHQRFGFSQTGTLSEVGYKFGRYVDTAWFEKALK